MANETTTSTLTVTPQVLIDAVRSGMQGMRVFGQLGIVTINASLPVGRYAGETVTVPYLAHLGAWAEYAENDEIALTAMTDATETASVARAGKAFTVTDMARILRGYASPMEAGRQMIQEGLAVYVENKIIAAIVARGTSTPAIVYDVHSAATPRYLDRDVFVAVRSRFGDETKGIVGTIAHSQVINRMLTLKDADGAPLHRVLEQDDENGVVSFEGLGRFYASDLMPVDYTVVSTGTTPPVLTLTGSPKGMYDQIRVECTTLGAFGTAQIRISTDGGTTWVASGVVVPVTGIVDRSDDLGLVFTFASGTFAVNNVYTSRGKATIALCKRGAGVLWHNDFGSVESMRDVRRKNEVVAADLLAVCHVYKKLNGGTRPGVAIAKHNI
jgi:hypothetical protein